MLYCFFFFSLFPINVLHQLEKKVKNMNPKFLEALEVRDSSVCRLGHGRAVFIVLSINSVCGLSKATENPDFSS